MHLITGLPLLVLHHPGALSFIVHHLSVAFPSLAFTSGHLPSLMASLLIICCLPPHALTHWHLWEASFPQRWDSPLSAPQRWLSCGPGPGREVLTRLVLAENGTPLAPTQATHCGESR